MRIRQPRGGHCEHPECFDAIHSRRLCQKHYRRVLASEQRTNVCGCGCGELTAARYVWGHHTRLFSSEEQKRRAAFAEIRAARAAAQLMMVALNVILDRVEAIERCEADTNIAASQNKCSDAL